MNESLALTSEQKTMKKSLIFTASTFIWIAIMVYIDKGILYAWFGSDILIHC